MRVRLPGGISKAALQPLRRSLQSSATPTSSVHEVCRTKIHSATAHGVFLQVVPMVHWDRHGGHARGPGMETHPSAHNAYLFYLFVFFDT